MFCQQTKNQLRFEAALYRSFNVFQISQYWLIQKMLNDKVCFNSYKKVCQAKIGKKSLSELAKLKTEEGKENACHNFDRNYYPDCLDSAVRGTSSSGSSGTREGKSNTFPYDWQTSCSLPFGSSGCSHISRASACSINGDDPNKSRQYERVYLDE